MKTKPADESLERARLWQRYDIQPHRVETFKISNDPKFEDKVRDVVGLYLDPPDRALRVHNSQKGRFAP